MDHARTVLSFLLCVTALFGATAADVAPPEALVYRTVGSRELKAFVFSPPVPAFPARTHRPAVLLFHGGAWNLGDASWVFDRAKEFAARGIVAVAVDYRLSGGGVAPLPINAGLTPVDSVEDACAAFAWSRSHARQLGIDPHRVAGYGVSAGGHLVATAATLPAIRGKAIRRHARPDALVLFSPALNMAKDEYFVSLMGGKDAPALYSPAEFIGRALPPTIIIQGEEDTIVKANDARAFCAAANAVGVRCELHVYPGVGHLLTRNLKVQYKDFDSDPAFAAEAFRYENSFLESLGYMK
jgi:acetyl esterase/lipase